MLSRHQGDLEHRAAFNDYRHNLALYAADNLVATLDVYGVRRQTNIACIVDTSVRGQPQCDHSRPVAAHVVPPWTHRLFSNRPGRHRGLTAAAGAFAAIRPWSARARPGRCRSRGGRTLAANGARRGISRTRVRSQSDPEARSTTLETGPRTPSCRHPLIARRMTILPSCSCFHAQHLDRPDARA